MVFFYFVVEERSNNRGNNTLKFDLKQIRLTVFQELWLNDVSASL